MHECVTNRTPRGSDIACSFYALVCIEVVLSTIQQSDLLVDVIRKLNCVDMWVVSVSGGQRCFYESSKRLLFKNAKRLHVSVERIVIFSHI